MLPVYFCLDDQLPVMRYWSHTPRIGETITLPELGGSLNPLKVFEVVWDGIEEPSVSIYLHRAGIDHGTGDSLTNDLRRERFE
jgi:hypothetical protein